MKKNLPTIAGILLALGYFSWQAFRCCLFQTDADAKNPAGCARGNILRGALAVRLHHVRESV